MKDSIEATHHITLAVSSTGGWFMPYSVIVCFDNKETRRNGRRFWTRNGAIAKCKSLVGKIEGLDSSAYVKETCDLAEGPITEEKLVALRFALICGDPLTMTRNGVILMAEGMGKWKCVNGRAIDKDAESFDVDTMASLHILYQHLNLPLYDYTVDNPINEKDLGALGFSYANDEAKAAKVMNNSMVTMMDQGDGTWRLRVLAPGFESVTLLGLEDLRAYIDITIPSDFDPNG